MYWREVSPSKPWERMISGAKIAQSLKGEFVSPIFGSLSKFSSLMVEIAWLLSISKKSPSGVGTRSRTYFSPSILRKIEGKIVCD